MARRSSKKSSSSEDWKSRFIYVQFSHNDEVEIADHVKQRGVTGVRDLLEDVLGNGGSIKFTHSQNDGGVFVTLSTDAKHSDYGGYSFGFRYSNLAGATAIADWLWFVVLSSDRGLKYLPTTLDDWLGLA